MLCSYLTMCNCCIVVISYTCVPFYYSLVSVRGMETFKIATPNNANAMGTPAIAVIRVPLATKNGTYDTVPSRPTMACCCCCFSSYSLLCRERTRHRYSTTPHTIVRNRYCTTIISVLFLILFCILVFVRGMAIFKIVHPKSANGMEILVIAVIRVPLETKNGTYYTEP